MQFVFGQVEIEHRRIGHSGHVLLHKRWAGLGGHGQYRDEWGVVASVPHPHRKNISIHFPFSHL
jgi:hypothetical protein